MKPARLSEKELRAMKGGNMYTDEAEAAARECLRLRRALRTLARMADDHSKRRTKYVECGWFADARAIIARALDATKGGK